MSDDTISRRANWSYSPVLPIKKSAKKLVIVITPSPPICTSSAMTISPSVENVEAKSTVVRPVTQTALVETKSASIIGSLTPSSVERGTISSIVPKNIIIRNVEARSSAGFVFRRVMLTTPREISIIENTAITAERTAQAERTSP